MFYYCALLFIFRCFVFILALNIYIYIYIYRFLNNAELSESNGKPNLILYIYNKKINVNIILCFENRILLFWNHKFRTNDSEQKIRTKYFKAFFFDSASYHQRRGSVSPPYWTGQLLNCQKTGLEKICLIRVLLGGCKIRRTIQSRYRKITFHK